MANVLFLTLVFAPDGVSTAVLMSELAQELHQQGHHITVLTTTPHYNVDPDARHQQPLHKRWGGLLYQSEYHGLTVYHATIPTKGSRVGARLLDYLRFHLISTWAGLTLTKQVDVLFVPSPPLTIGLSAWLLSLFKRAPFIYNVQEIYPDVAVKLGVLTNPTLIRLLEAMERFIYRRAQKITVISDRFAQQLRHKGVPDHQLAIIPNFVDTEFITPQPRQNAFSAAHNLDHKFVVLYAGNIGLTQGFESIMAAARALQEIPAIHFLIVGDGTRRTWLEAELQREPAPNVTLLPYQARSAVPLIYATADLCLVPLKKGTAHDTFPSKIYTIMAAQRPVIASTDDQSELADLVHRADCGWVIPPDDAPSLEQTIRTAYEQPALTQHKGHNGLTHVQTHYARRAVVQQYNTLLRELTQHE